MSSMFAFKSLLLELDSLKGVYRKSFISAEKRKENSAEHSWHLAVAVIAMKHFLPDDVNVERMIQLSLLHDVCEIGAGDVCSYHSDKSQQREDEKAYIINLKGRHPQFGEELMAAWSEYESQETQESRWLMLFDKLVPFLLNIATECRTWREQNIDSEMVKSHNKFIQDLSPEIHSWMMGELNVAVKNGWINEPNKQIQADALGASDH